MPCFKDGMTDLSPSSPIDEQPVIGIIGMGAMGRMYAKYLSTGGWKKIYVCDREEKYEQLRVDVKDLPGVTVLKNGHLVARCSDFIMYSVEAEFIDRVVAEYGPSTKVGAVVSGQTSVKDPERQAFEKHLPRDVHIVSCIIQHRGPDWARHLVEIILAPFKSHYVYLSYEEHDLITANTQAVTHAAFLSMGTAWNCAGYFPWEEGTYVRGIETVKVNIMLRIYSNQWHVYAGLAILNPSAKVQIHQFAQSATDLFKLMIKGDEEGLRKRVYRARDIVFDDDYREGIRKEPIILSEKMLDQFSLARTTAESVPTSDDDAPTAGSNSHLALLTMVDCWAELSIRPFQHLELLATPIFRLLIGVAEYLFRDTARLDAAIHTAAHDPTHRSDDVEYVIAARGWSQCVSFGSFELYERRFKETATFFEHRFADANKLGAQMIKAILEGEQSGSNRA
ncbi:prephenate dehydrogenase (NADP(+)) [Tulasnella sp. 424]|nr:prephenate dehydrogenase (NADP(+)) [Tulasnella sp. 424]KAG8970191.1 prephenate dehydrogenase (NADP(+)) [Tulasnella sp. 425]